MKILALLDPFPGYDFRKDTSHLLLLEAHRRGHQVCYGEIGKITIDSKKCGPSIRCVPVIPLQTSPHFEWGSALNTSLADFDVILVRQDPPVDEAYVHATQILSLVPKKTVVLNPPHTLRDYNEKLIIFHFPEWIPRTRVSQNVLELAAFHQEIGGKTILKPLDGFAGKGIQLIESPAKIPPPDQPVMIQEFLPEITQGEKRLFFLEDKVLASLLKIPPVREFLANPDLGATLKITELTPRERHLAEELGRFFRQNGVFLAGVDLIGEKLTEINITSPGLLWELNELYNAHFERDIIDALEKKIRS